MIFSTPLAAFGFLTLAGLAAIYCFRRKSPRRSVSSLLLWPAPKLAAVAARRRDVMRLPPIFWLELFILLALVTAALSPLGWRAGTGTMHVIVDDTPSMHAFDPQSPAKRAADFLAHVQRHPPKDAIRVRTVTRADAFDRALAAARSMRAPEDEILVLTDRAPTDEERHIPGLRWESFGAPAANLAITAARRLRKSPSEDGIFIEVRRFAPSAAAPASPAQVTLAIGGRAATLDFDDNGRARFRGTAPASDQSISVAIPDDALSADNTLELAPPDVPCVDTALEIADKELAALVQRALDATGYVRRITTPDAAQLVVTDDPSRDFPGACYRLVFTPGGKSLAAGPVWTDPGSDLLDGVALEGESYALAPTPLSGTPLALLGSTPLVTAGTNFCALAFASPVHAFFRSPGFPSLMQNVLAAVDAQTRRLRTEASANPLDERESDLTRNATMSLRNPAPPPPDAVRTSSIAWIPALLAALALALHFRFVRRRGAFIVMALALLALARPVLPTSEHRGTLIVVADQSRSMPADAAKEQARIISSIAAMRPENASLGVVTFGGGAAIEKRPDRSGFDSFTQVVDADGSDIAAAIEKASALANPDEPTRMLVISDGLFTAPTPAVFAHPVDTYLQTRAFLHDLSVSRIDAPAIVDPRAVIPITAWVHSPDAVTNNYALLRGTNVIARGRRAFTSGFTPLVFRDHAGSGGLHRYTLAVTPAEDDPCPENNRAAMMVSVEGARPVLFLTDNVKSTAAESLHAAGMPVTQRTVQSFPSSLAALENYSGVVLENVPAKHVSTDLQRDLVAFVADLGRGLAFTGGEKSFGPGGWYKSAVEDILPVTLEMRQEHRKYAIAISIVMDRSGSMAAPTSDGRTKMDMANLGAVGAIDMLSPADEVAVLAVDSQPHLILKMQDIETAKKRLNDVLSIKSMGGGIFIKEGLVAGLRELEHASAPIRHLILFADASDSEEPDDYKNYLAKAREAGITVSVIGLGTSHDCDSELLKDIAKRGGGECWFEERAEEIPRLFLQDTFLTAKETMCTNLTPLRACAPLRRLSDRLPAKLPPIGGYNLTYVRPEAETAIVTEDDEHAPLLAIRRVGLGRTLAFTGEISGSHAAPLMTSEHGAELTAAIVRALQDSEPHRSGGFTFERRLVPGGIRVTAVADDDSPATLVSHAGLPLVVVRDRPDSGSKREATALTWESADTLSTFVPLASDETAFLVARPPEGAPVVLPPTCLPYSAEYRRGSSPTEGKDALERLASRSGGRALATTDGIWDMLPATRQYHELAPWLFLLASLLFLGFVFMRRLGLRPPWPFRRRSPVPPMTAPKPAGAPTDKAPANKAPTDKQPARRKTGLNAAPTVSSTAAALSQAKRRAGFKN